MKTLHLTLKKKWFDMILFAIKKEEYREIKPYWIKRLEGKSYDDILFKNGYSKNSPYFRIQCKGVHKGKGREEWGAPNKDVYIISLGETILFCDALKDKVEKYIKTGEAE